MNLKLALITFIGLNSAYAFQKGERYFPYLLTEQMMVQKRHLDKDIRKSRIKLKKDYPNVPMTQIKVTDVRLNVFSKVQELIDTYETPSSWQDLCVARTVCPYQNGPINAQTDVYQYDLGIYPELLAQEISTNDVNTKKLKNFIYSAKFAVKSFLYFERPFHMLHPLVIKATRDSLRKVFNGKQSTMSAEELVHFSTYYNSVMFRWRGGGFSGPPAMAGARRKRMGYHENIIVHTANLGKFRGSSGTMGTYSYAAVTEGWTDFFDIGTNPGEDRYHDLIFMTLRGKFQTSGVPYRPATQIFDHLRQIQRGFNVEGLLNSNGYDWTLLRVAGLQLGPCYYLGHWRMKNFQIKSNPGSELNPLERGSTNFGEMCFGASLGYGLMKTFLEASKHRGPRRR